MSFNTSNISCDTLIGVYNISAPIHLVDGIPITKSGANLLLGNSDNATAECLELQVDTQLSAPLALIDSINIQEIIPRAGSGTDILVDGNFDLQNNNLKNVNSLTVSNGAGLENQVLSLDSSLNLLWKNDAVADVSQWATYDAVADVNLNNNSITNVNTISYQNANLQNSAKDAQFTLTYGNSTAEPSLPAIVYTAPELYSYLSLTNMNLELGGDCGVVIPNGTIQTKFLQDPVGAGAFDLNTIAGTMSSSIGMTISGFGDISSSSETIINSGNTKHYTQTVENVGGVDVLQFKPSTTGMGIYLENTGAFLAPNTTFLGDTANFSKISTNAHAGQVFKVSSAGSNYSLALDADTNTLDSLTNINFTNMGNIGCEKVLPVFKLNTDYYVSSNGDDTNGNGSMENPFATIQNCINVCETLTTSDNVYRYIHIMGGTYSENLTISKKVFLIGEAESPYSASVGCQLAGNISININANGTDMFNNACNIMGLLISGKVEFTSTNNSVLNIENTYIFTPNNSSGRGIYFNPSASNSRLRIWNSQVISGGATGTDPLIELTSVGSLNMNNCYLSAKGLQNCLLFSGTSTCDTIVNCKFECSNSGASVLPIVAITATVSGTYSFGVCAFFYSSNTSKTANLNACGILNNNASGNNNILVNYCSFFLLGTNTSNFAIQDANFGTGTAVIVLYYMNNASLTNAFAIHGILNTTKFQLQTVS